MTGSRAGRPACASPQERVGGPLHDPATENTEAVPALVDLLGTRLGAIPGSELTSVLSTAPGTLPPGVGPALPHLPV